MRHSLAYGISKASGGKSTYRSHLDKFKSASEEPWVILGQRPGVQGEIARDVHRTFASRDLFRVKKGLGQRMLFNILAALAKHDSKVGYCQGMNFVVGVMLCVALKLVYVKDSKFELDLATVGLSSEEQEDIENQVFWLMIAFLNRFDMRELWRPGVPQLKLRIYQFDRLISSKLPKISQHFREIGLAPDFFASQWFLTLMSYNIPMEELVRVWDVLIFDGWKTIFRVGLHVLRSRESEILNMGLEQLSNFFKVGKLNEAGTSELFMMLKEEHFIQSAFTIKVSTQELSDLEGSYISHIMSQQLDQHNLAPSDDTFVDHRIAAVFRDEIDLLDCNAKHDVAYLRNKIEEADKMHKIKDKEFKATAKRYMEIAMSLDELKQSKKSVSDQLIKMTSYAQGSDTAVFLDKIEWLEHRIRVVADQFRDAMWQTSQAQLSMEEAAERKVVFSQQLHAVLDNSEVFKTTRLKQLWSQLQ